MGNDPTARALHLLSLLQTHQLWQAAALAERLGVTERTVRRDVDRLRKLGYPVDATTGTAGGYRLAVGAHLPPLVLDDDEAVAVVLGLRSAAGAAIGGIDDTSLRALAKIEQLLPDRLRRRVSALHSSIVELRRSAPDDEIIDPDALSVLAAACRDCEEVRFDYRRRDGDDSKRHVEPHQLVSAGNRWYLVAFDLRRDDWRSFRLDRLSRARLAGGRFAAREIPGGNAAAFIATSFGAIPRTIEAVVTVEAPYPDIEPGLRWVEHHAIESDPTSCIVRLGAEQLEQVTMAIVRIALAAPVTHIEPRQVDDAVARIVRQLPSSATATS